MFSFGNLCSNDFFLKVIDEQIVNRKYYFLKTLVFKKVFVTVVAGIHTKKKKTVVAGNYFLEQCQE